jgi:hypothetical protein
MDKKILALVGVAVIVVGLFLPIMSLPIVGSVNMLLPGGGIGDGIFVLVFALVGAGLALVGQVRHVIWPALASLAFIGWKFFQLKGAVDAGRDQVMAQGGADYVAAYGDAIQMNYLGWAVLCIGSIVLLVAGIMAWTGPKAAAPPPPM